MSSRVFIPQVPMKFDPNAGGMVPKFDTLSEAKQFGKLVVLIDSPLSFASRQECTDKIRSGLSDYNNDDYFLPMGSHYFMMLAAIIISNKVNVLRILEWDSRYRQYSKTETAIDDLLLLKHSARR